jgi:hypothetical protein
LYVSKTLLSIAVVALLSKYIITRHSFLKIHVNYNVKGRNLQLKSLTNKKE